MAGGGCWPDNSDVWASLADEIGLTPEEGKAAVSMLIGEGLVTAVGQETNDLTGRVRSGQRVVVRAVVYDECKVRGAVRQRRAKRSIPLATSEERSFSTTHRCSLRATQSIELDPSRTVG